VESGIDITNQRSLQAEHLREHGQEEGVAEAAGRVSELMDFRMNISKEYPRITTGLGFRWYPRI
jgi:hypothetical protein